MIRQSDLIEVKVSDCAGTIVLNRPEHGNRLTRQMLQLLGEAIDDLYYEKRVRAIILTGAGDVFCEGLELSEFQHDQDDPAALPRFGEDAAEWRDLLLRMLQITKPIIASVNGSAWSAGAGLVLASDIVVAAEAASFGLPDPRMGLVAGVVAPLLSFRLGAGQAARLLLTSQILDAGSSHKIGLFHEVISAEKSWARAMQLAQECAAGAPEAIQLTKRLLNETLGEHLEMQLSAGAAMRATAFITEAAREGIEAHLQNRPPNWK